MAPDARCRVDGRKTPRPIRPKAPAPLRLAAGTLATTCRYTGRIVSAQPFAFTGAEGQRLSGLLDLPERSPQAVALFAHCFTCTKHSVAAVRVARALTTKGFGVLRFDFTGLGKSEGDFADGTFSGSVRNLVAAGQALGERLAAPSLLIGHSLGGAAARRRSRRHSTCRR